MIHSNSLATPVSIADITCSASARYFVEHHTAKPRSTPASRARLFRSAYAAVRRWARDGMGVVRSSDQAEVERMLHSALVRELDLKGPAMKPTPATAGEAVDFVSATILSPRTTYSGQARRFRSAARRCERQAKAMRPGVPEEMLRRAGYYAAARELHNAANRADASAHLSR